MQAGPGARFQLAVSPCAGGLPTWPGEKRSQANGPNNDPTTAQELSGRRQDYTPRLAPPRRRTAHSSRRQERSRSATMRAGAARGCRWSGRNRRSHTTRSRRGMTPICVTVGVKPKPHAPEDPCSQHIRRPGIFTLTGQSRWPGWQALLLVQYLTPSQCDGPPRQSQRSQPKADANQPRLRCSRVPHYGI
jgi:hypothetical protein